MLRRASQAAGVLTRKRGVGNMGCLLGWGPERAPGYQRSEVSGLRRQERAPDGVGTPNPPRRWQRHAGRLRQGGQGPPWPAALPDPSTCVRLLVCRLCVH